VNDPRIQSAISDLAMLRPGWSLLADTDPKEFLEQVTLEICTLRSACRMALEKCAFPVGAQKAKQKIEECLEGLEDA